MSTRTMTSIPGKQTGASTLIVSTILLFAVTVVVINSANLGLVETKTSANSYRAEQALAAAHAGMEQAIATLTKFNYANVSKTTINGLDGSSAGSYQVSYTNGGNNTVTVTSTGYSKDNTASKTVKQKLAFAQVLHPWYADTLIAAVTASGRVSLDHTKLTKNGANWQVNAGSSVNPIKLNAYNGSLPNEVKNDATALQEISLLNSFISENNSDVSSLFGKIFANNSSSVMSHFAWQHDCSSGCSNPSALSDTNNQGKMHAVKGSLTLSGATVGSSTKPVILYVDLSGNKTLVLKNNTKIYGLLYVKLDSGRTWNNGTNAATITGALVVDSNSTNSEVYGSKLSVSYNLQNLDKIGVYTSMPGTWSDS